MKNRLKDPSPDLARTVTNVSFHRAAPAACARNNSLIAVIYFVSFVTTLFFALARGQDINWDQRNYHIGIPTLLAQGSFWASAAPANIPSYQNPLLAQADLLIITHLPPMLASAVLALVQSLAPSIAGVMCLRICAPTGAATWRPRAGRIAASLGFALCLMTPVALSEAGTTFVDTVTAGPVLLAYLLLLTRDDSVVPSQRRRIRHAALAGVLLGAMAALKLTNAVFVISSLGFAFAGRERLTERLIWLLWLACGATFTAIVVGGPWSFQLWQHFGNPVFPYFNAVFQSPEFPNVNWADGHFHFNSVFDLWRVPLHWLHGTTDSPLTMSPTAELRFTDVRWFFINLAVPGFLGLLLVWPPLRRRWLADPATGLLFAVILGFLAWARLFAISRYLAPVDILAGAAALCLSGLLPWQALRLFGLTAFTLLCLDKVEVMDWEHVPWQARWSTINTQRLDLGGDALVFLLGEPLLFTAASLQPNTIYVGLDQPTAARRVKFDLRGDQDNAFTRSLHARLSADPALKILTLGQRRTTAWDRELLASYGLQATANCRQMIIGQIRFDLCDVERSSP